MTTTTTVPDPVLLQRFYNSHTYGITAPWLVLILVLGIVLGVLIGYGIGWYRARTLPRLTEEARPVYIGLVESERDEANEAARNHRSR